MRQRSCCCSDLSRAAVCRRLFIFVGPSGHPLQPVTTDETVSVGGTVTLTCRVAESDNSSLQWSNTAQQTLYFGEKRALRDSRIQLYRSTSTELSITIADVQLSDEGEYTCSIFTMPVRTARATVTVLGVPGKPQISGFENAVPEGGKVTLTCISTGSKPPAKLIWYRGDQELEGERYRKCADSLSVFVSELTLEVSRSDNNALITCAVDHPSLAPGDKRSEQALAVHLRILMFSVSPLSLSCLRPASYFWEKKDGELPPLAKVDGAFLRFEMLNKSDNGVYHCRADNIIGSSEGEFAFCGCVLYIDNSSLLLSFLFSLLPLCHSPHYSLSLSLFLCFCCLSSCVSRFRQYSSATPSALSLLSISVSCPPPTLFLAVSFSPAVLYLIRHKGTYLTHEAKGSDDAPDADTAIINAEGGHSGAEDKKEYFI
uniref:Cell adhesion molecule 3 n=1 Tax=Echeneis naucrates TaxID=173247 RepID=A0A665VF51_ECHNA